MPSGGGNLRDRNELSAFLTSFDKIIDARSIPCTAGADAGWPSVSPNTQGKWNLFGMQNPPNVNVVRSHTIIIVGLIGPLLVSTLLLHDGAVNKNHCHLVKLSVVDLFLLRSGHVT